MASSRSLQETVGDVTECSICTESMVDPRQLPCIHTFCFKCLDQLWKDKQPGVKVPCPLCRGEVVIPVGGVSGLPKNFFIEKLVEAQKVSETEHAVVRCDICLKHEAPDSGTSISEIFCLECEQHMCNMCLKWHSSMNTTSKHHVIPTGSKLTATEGWIHFPEARCQSHKGKEIDIYCMECKAAVCTICFITQHNGHKCADMQQVTDDLKKKIRSDIEVTRKIVVEVDIASKQLETSLEDFNLSVKQTESNIVQTGEKMKQLIDKQVRDLLQEMGDEKTKRIKEFENVREELLVQRLSLESFIKYSEKILEKAVAADVASVANSLSIRVVSLQNKKVPLIGKSLEISFSARDLLFSVVDGDDKNSIGKIIVHGNIASGRTFSYTNDPTKIASFPSSGSTRGMALLEGTLFIVNYSSPDVTEFDSSTYEFKSKFTVPGLSEAWGIAASKNVLFVSEYRRNIIHRIQSPEKVITAWSSGGTGNSLSISKQGNVLVSSQTLNKLIEYTDTGTILREIPLPSGVDCPLCSIQLDNNRFLVSHSGKVHHRVCLVDDTAQLLKSYGGTPGSGSGQLHYPYQFVVDQIGFILVANYGNHRVVLLNAQLEYMKDLIPTSAGGQSTFATTLDEFTGKLYLASDNDKNKQISVFQLND